MSRYPTWIKYEYLSWNYVLSFCEKFNVFVVWEEVVLLLDK